jgi:hypothetical protein
MTKIFIMNIDKILIKLFKYLQLKTIIIKFIIKNFRILKKDYNIFLKIILKIFKAKKISYKIKINR